MNHSDIPQNNKFEWISAACGRTSTDNVIKNYARNASKPECIFNNFCMTSENVFLCTLINNSIMGKNKGQVTRIVKSVHTSSKLTL